MNEERAGAFSALERRRYDQVGPQRPLAARFDLDGGDDPLSLALIGPGDDCPEEVADLALMGAAAQWLGFVAPDANRATPLSPSQRVRRGEYATLAIDRARILRAAALGQSRIEIKAKIVRSLRASDISHERTLWAVVTLFSSRVPELSARLAVEETIDVERLGPEALRAPVARLDFECAAFDVRPEGRCRVRIEALYTGFGAGSAAPSIQAHRLRDDPEDEHWRESAVAIIEDVEIDADQLRPTLQTIKFAVSYRELRDFVGRTPPPRAFAIWVRASVEPNDLDTAWRELAEAKRRVEVVGEVRDRLIFSGLGDGAPAAVFLTPRGQPPMTSIYPIAAARLRKDALGRLYVAGKTMRISLDGPGTLLIEIDCAVIVDGRERGRRETSYFELTEAGFIAYDIALDECLAEIAPEEIWSDARCVVALRSRRAGSEAAEGDRFAFAMPIEFETKLPDWFACVDFGASSTAIRVSSGRTNTAALDLKLGDWFARRADPLHEESLWWRGQAGGGEASAGYLMPSRVGLSTTFNTRAHFDPLSLGDLRLAEAQSAPARLAALDRNYDVSLPFPGREALAEHIDYVIVDLKRRMISRARHARLPADVTRRGSLDGEAPGDVDLARLLADCFHELGVYVAPGALELAAKSNPRGQSFGSAAEVELDRADVAKRFGVIVSHPAGVDGDRRRAYREAGLRFLDGFHPASNARGRGSVLLVGEALAAARFGVQKHIERNRAFATPVERDFITLDIGAGTYDVTIIRATLTDSRPSGWRVIDHFGLTCGGADLDAAIAARVRGALQAALASPSLTAQFEIDAALPVSPDELRDAPSPEIRRLGVRFLAHVQAAKARLTKALLDADEGYVWRSKSDGGPPLDIQVGTAATDKDWPVRATGPLANAVIEIPGANAWLVVETIANVKTIRLKFWREAFERPAHRERTSGIEDWIDLMAGEIPRMAWFDYRRRIAGAEPKAAPVWIVTGRAALWPHLYCGIASTLESLGPAAGALDTEAPPTPAEMKRAVVEGAALLAREPWAAADEAVRNPVALLAFAATQARGASIVPIVETDEASPPDIIRRLRHGFAIARIAPGLDETEGLDRRLELFRRLGVACWEELESEVRPPAGTEGQEIDWTVSTRRDASGLSLKLTPKVTGGASYWFGPFKESRVYGKG